MGLALALLWAALAASGADARPKPATSEEIRGELHEMILAGKVEEAERELEKHLAAAGADPSASSRYHLELGLARSRRRDEARALGHWEAAVDDARRAEDRRVESMARHYAGDLYMNKRDQARAKAEYEAALALARAAGDWDQSAELGTHLSFVHYDAQDYKGALRRLDEGVDDGRKSLRKNGLAMAMSQRANLRAAMKDLRGALADAVELEQINRGLGNDRNVYAAIMTAAAVRSQMDDLPGAAADIERAFAFARERKQVSLEVGALTQLADLRWRLGEFGAAVGPGRKALTLARSKGNDADVAMAAHDLGVIYDQIGDYPSALELLEESLVLRRKLGQNPANDLNSLGIIHTNRGDGDEAVKVLTEAYSLNNWRGGMINLGDAYMVAGRRDDAHLAYQKVDHRIGLGRWQLLYGSVEKAKEIYLEMLPRQQRGRLFDSLTANYTALGLIYERTGHPDIASGYYRRSTEVLERMRDALTPEARLHFMGGNDWLFPRLEPYEGLVRVTKELAEGPAGAFRRAEFTRSRAFSEAASARAGKPETRIPPALAARERALTTELGIVNKKLDLTVAVDDALGRAPLDMRLRDLKKQRDVLVAELRRDHPAYAAVVYPLPVGAEQAALDPDEVLVEFEVTEPYTRAFVVRGGSVTLTYDVKLTRVELAEKVRRYRRAFEGVTDAAGLAAFDPALGRELYRLLLAPALEGVPKDARILIVPDEVLGLLPFEGLATSVPERLSMPAGRHGPAPAGVRYVADDWDVAYVHSATALTVLRRLRTKPPAGDAVLVLADPVFDKSDSRARGALTAKASPPPAARARRELIREMGLGGARAGLAAGKSRGDESSILFPRLDRTSDLARALSREFGDKADALTGPEAAERGLRSRDMSRYRHVVFATHGLLSDAVPGVHEPALVLNQFGNGAGEDGFLTMSEVLAMRLDAEVAALTACQTGLGRLATGEGVMGLGRAFQQAGARHVLMSLWSVAEDSTTELAARFFKKLKAGSPPRRALREARMELRREGWEHPYYWAPFILVTS